MPTIGTRGNAAARGYGFTGAAAAEVLGGMVLMTPTSIASTGTGNSSSINENGSVTFSSCATLSLNGVFTSDYDNYMISIRHSTGGDNTLNMRFRASGTDNSTANSYVFQYLFADSTAVTAARTTTTSGSISYRGNTQRAGVTGYIYGPFLTQPTVYRSDLADDYLSATVTSLAGTHNQSTSYDGFSLIASAGSFTGLISVYGLGG